MNDVVERAKLIGFMQRFTHWNRMGILAMRVFKLLRRYGLNGAKFNRNFELYTQVLKRHQARATFPTTAVTLSRHPKMMGHLCDCGVELAIHGYTHIDHSQLDFETQKRYIAQAVETFQRIGLKPTGMRAPYLWWNKATREAALANGLKYTSNQVFIWDAYDTPEVRSLYHIKQKPPRRSLPKCYGGLVEIPVSLPDDFILSERIGLAPERTAQIWTNLLDVAAQRNQMFTLQLHPELIFPCAKGLDALLAKARGDDRRFWCACLDEVATWWRDRCQTDAEASPTADGYTISFSGPEDAVWLLKKAASRDYHPMTEKKLELKGGVLPFVAVPASASLEALAELKEEGYIVRQGVDTPADYAVYLDESALGCLSADVWQQKILSTKHALVKCARWPANRQAALVITGDLDCVTLFDYFWRLLGK